MRVFRLHIRPSGGLGNPKYSFAYCLREGVLGVGWQIEKRTKNLSWQEYERLATRVYGKSALSRVRYLRNNVRRGDLIWTRDTVGKYYLAKVAMADRNSDQDLAWEYSVSDEARKADIVNVVKCSKIVPVPNVDDIPGKIIACFRPSRVIQSIKDDTAIQYSQLLWNQLIGFQEFKLSSSKASNIFSYLDAEDTEDVIFIYLQIQGWIVVPNSRKADTMGWEYIVINRQTKRRAIVQVKTGKTPLDSDVWVGRKETVFLFQAGGIYTGASHPNIFKINPKKIEKFMHDNYEIMTGAVKRWLDFSGK